MSAEFAAVSPVPFIESFTHPFSHGFAQQTLSACHTVAS